MRTEDNHLDLNNLPVDFGKDGKQVHDDSSSYAGYRKKKSGGNKEGKEEMDKVYECRFCSLKFCKSQALGGHMNRHRQERETETLNRARQLVFNNDTLLGPGPPLPHHHLGGQSIPHGGGYHHQADHMQFRPVYQPRHFPGSATLLPQPPPPQQPYTYSSPTRLLPFSAGSHHYSTTSPSNNHDYFLGHVFPPNAPTAENAAPAPINYTCIGAPVGLQPRVGFGSGSDDHDQEGGAMGWGATRNTTTPQPMEKHCFDQLASINRFQNGF